MYVKISIKKYKQLLILCFAKECIIFENKELYSKVDEHLKKVLKSFQTNAINNVILDIDLLTDRIGWVDLLKIVLKY